MLALFNHVLTQIGQIMAMLGASFVPQAHAGEVYGPPVPVEQPAPAPRAPERIATPLTREQLCVRKWRGRAFAAHAADTATTVAAIESGKGREGNPLVTALFGKKPKAWQVIAFKAGTVGGLELLARHGTDAERCSFYRRQTLVIGGIAALNLRVFF